MDVYISENAVNSKVDEDGGNSTDDYLRLLYILYHNLCDFRRVSI